MGDIENELQGYDGCNKSKRSDIIAMQSVGLKEDTNSMPGSLIDPSGEPIDNNTSPVCADDGYRS